MTVSTNWGFWLVSYSRSIVFLEGSISGSLIFVNSQPRGGVFKHAVPVVLASVKTREPRTGQHCSTVPLIEARRAR